MIGYLTAKLLQNMQNGKLFTLYFVFSVVIVDLLLCNNAKLLLLWIEKEKILCFALVYLYFGLAEVPVIRQKKKKFFVLLSFIRNFAK